MTDAWTIYNILVLAKDILGRTSRFAPTEELNDAIDKAFNLLDYHLPRLKNFVEDVEETDEDSP